MQKARNPRTEVADFIIDDLKEAAKLLPVDKAISSSDEGRLSSEAALAFLSRVALYEGTWEKFHNGGQNTERTKDLLNTAAQAAHDVMAGGAFELLLLKNWVRKPTNISLSWRMKSRTLPVSIKQVIKSISLPAATTLLSILSGSTSPKGVWAMPCTLLAKWLICICKAMGLPINPQTWNYTKVDDEYKNRDNRMNNQLMVPGQTYWGTNGGRIDWSGNAAEIANASHRNFIPQTGTGYFPHKWCSERDGVPTGMEAYDFPIIRYAEVLLNYAEAVFERDGQISDEDLAISLNLTRKRINPEMPDLTNDFVTANNLDMRTEIRRERTIEFFDENFRIDDLKRWKTAEDEMPMNLTGVKWKGTDFENRWPDASFKEKDGEGCIIHEKGRNWHEKHYLLPLPTDQLKLNSNLKQNPGWNQ